MVRDRSIALASGLQKELALEVGSPGDLLQRAAPRDTGSRISTLNIVPCRSPGEGGEVNGSLLTLAVEQTDSGWVRE